MRTVVAIEHSPVERTPMRPSLSTGSPWNSSTGRDRGSGTVLLLGVVGAVLLAMVGALQVVSAVVASHRAQAAADLASLAGAAVAVHGGSVAEACATAARIAAANAGTVQGCAVDATTAVVVTVVVPARSVAWGLGLGPAIARSRAGPR